MGQTPVGAIVKTLTETQNSVKLNHHYLHEVFDRTWATLAHLKTQTELEEMDFERDFEWSWPPKKKFRPIPVPDLEDSSFSSFCTAETDEEQLDTATCNIPIFLNSDVNRSFICISYFLFER